MYKYLVKKPKRSWMNLSHEFKFDTGFGSLVPILCEEILPNDKIKLSSEMFTRFSALIAPAFQRCDARIEYFFVPNRILWDDWDKFISNSEDASIVKPYVNLDDLQAGHLWESNSLADYLGFPAEYTDVGSSSPHSPRNERFQSQVDILPFRAYYKIWYDWYRDENVMTTSPEPRTGGGRCVPSAENIFDLQTRCYPRDYFTSALPFAQQGANPVRLPLNYPNGAATTLTNVGTASGDVTVENYVAKVGSSNARFKLNNISDVVQGPTIEEMRRSSAVQRWLEKNIRFGGRYVEQIASHFGIHVGDYRLDRPEYLGGGKVNVKISEVLQTSESTQNSALGDDGGHAIASGAASIRKPYTAVEHGWLIGLLSFVPKASYGQGWPKKFNRWEVTDYAFPEFDNLGEQPIYKGELYAYDGHESEIFGYQPRYDEYKHSYDRYAGQFRSSLSYWHLGRIFSESPSLSAPFVGINWNNNSGPQTDPDRLTRMFATDDTRNIIVDLYNHVFIKRALSKSDMSVLK